MIDIYTTSFLYMYRRIKPQVCFLCKYIRIRCVFLLECEHLEPSKAKKKDAEMGRSSLMENWHNGFLAMVKCVSTGHLLINNVICVTLNVLYTNIWFLWVFKDTH